MTSLNRRSFLQVSGLSVSGLALSAAALPALARTRTATNMTFTDTTYFQWKEPIPGVHAGFGEGGNTVVLVGKGESLLVDTKNCGFAQTLRREAESLGAPLKLVINSHHHADHTAGNYGFSSDLTLLAHDKAIARIGGQYSNYKNCASATLKALNSSDKPEAKTVLAEVEKLVKAFPEIKAFIPTRAFANKDGREEIMIGGEKVELTHVGAGHTDNDLIIRFPNKNVVHTGDLVFNNVWPYTDRAGGCSSEGWVKSLEKIKTMCDDKTVVIPGHGELTDRAGVDRQIALFQDLRARAAKAVKDGTSHDDFLKASPDEYKDYGGGDRSKMVLGFLYDEAAGAPPAPK